MVDDDGVPISADKAMETFKFAAVWGENSRLIVVVYSVGAGEAGRGGDVCSRVQQMAQGA